MHWLSWLPDEWRKQGIGWIVTLFFAWVGRMAWHVKMVRDGHRRFWTMDLVWDVFFAVALGFATSFAAEYFGVTGRPALALVIVVSYLGPAYLEVLANKLADRIFGGPLNPRG